MQKQQPNPRKKQEFLTKENFSMQALLPVKNIRPNQNKKINLSAYSKLSYRVKFITPKPTKFFKSP